MNRVQIMGNLTKDPELNYTKNNTALTRVGIAVNRSYKDANDQWQEKATFLDVTFWGKLAEKVAQLKKGERVYIEGRLDNQEWTTKTGEKRKGLAITASDFFASARQTSTPPEEDFDVPDEPEEKGTDDTKGETNEGADDGYSKDVPF